MRPVPIPDDAPLGEGAQRVAVSPPGGDLTHPTIRPLEAVVHRGDAGEHLVTVRCALEGDDLQRLAAGGHVWITFAGGIVPFSLAVTGQPDA